MNTILRTAPVRAAAPVAARRSVVARSGPGKVYTVEKVTAATVNGQDAAQIDDAINAIRRVSPLELAPSLVLAGRRGPPNAGLGAPSLPR